MGKWVTVFLLFFLTIQAIAQQPRLMLPLNHTGDITSAQFSPDDKKVVTASSDNTAKIWDAKTGNLLVDLKGHKNLVSLAVFSSDGLKIATASDDSTAKIWDAQTGKILQELKGHTHVVHSADFNKEGTLVVTASEDRTAKIWDVKSGDTIVTIRWRSELTSAVFSPDGKNIITTSSEYLPQLWDAASGNNLGELKGNEALEYSGAIYSKDGKKILAVAGDTSIQIWDPASRDILLNLQGNNDRILSAAFNSAGNKIVSVHRNNLMKLWDAITGTVLKKWQEDFTRVSFGNMDDKIVSGHRSYMAKIWDTINTVPLLTLQGHTQNFITVRFSPEGSKLLTADNFNTYKIWDTQSGGLLSLITIEGNEKNQAIFSPDGSKLITIQASDAAKLWDAGSGKLLKEMTGHQNAINAAQFSRDGKKIATASQDGTVKIWNGITGEFEKEIPGNAPKKNAVFSPDGTKIAIGFYDKSISPQIWNLDSIKRVTDFAGYYGMLIEPAFSNDGTKLITPTFEGKVMTWNAENGDELISSDSAIIQPALKSAIFNHDGLKILTTSLNNSPELWDAVTGKLIARLDRKNGYTTFARFNPDGKTIITVLGDTMVNTWDAETGRFLNEIYLGSSSRFMDVHFNSNRLISTENAEAKMLSLNTGEPLFSFFCIDSTDWAVLHSSGLFDATPGAMDKMYWVKGNEIIEFSQLKERYYQPGLWSLRTSGKSLRDVEGMGTLKMQPEVEVSQPKGGIITIKLIKRDGGYGKVSVFVNNKERIEDARGANFDNTKPIQTISVNLTPWLVPRFDNTIAVKAQSADGFVTGRAITVNFGKTSQSQKRNPSFYAIICGTGQYSTPEITLKYPVPDAKAIAEAITLGANNLFGTDSAHVYLLTSPGDNPTTKKNIQNTFAEVKKRAKPDDIVLVYLSGHGVTFGGEKGDFFYLTTDAGSKDADGYKDPAIREKQTISTKEFTTLLNAIPALKQVMIIDACGSGKAVDNLISKRDIDASQIKAIDRMKDRTGLYIISGCAADAESYESSIYGQGLLTYAILEAMKGAALKQNKYVDIYSMLDHAREQVPKFARGLGGIQKPQLLMPKGGSFDIGIINESDKDKIPLSGVKLVFTRTTVLDKDKNRDVLKLSPSINEKLNDLATPLDGKGTIVFIDSDEFPEGCNISGVYQVINGLIDFNGSILCGGTETPLKFEKLTKEKLLEELMKMVAKMGEDADKVKKALQ